MKVTVRKLSKRMSDTSTEPCGWGRRGNGYTQAATWALLVDGEHVATTSSNGDFWVISTPTGRRLAGVQNKQAAVQWVQNKKCYLLRLHFYA